MHHKLSDDFSDDRFQFLDQILRVFVDDPVGLLVQFLIVSEDLVELEVGFADVQTYLSVTDLDEFSALLDDVISVGYNGGAYVS